MSNEKPYKPKYEDRQGQQTALTLSTPKELAGFLIKSKTSIVAALPAHLNPDRMIRLAVTCFSQNPALQRCSAVSIFSSLLIASQLGLEPGVAGQGYLIPYKGKCTFVPGWQGLVGLLNNTGRATAWTGVVYEGDHFQFELGAYPILRHVPGINYGDEDKMTWAYACARVNGAETPVIEAWTMERIWRHRDAHNEVGEKHYSYKNPEMYARKVVLLQVLKYMPKSVEVANAIEVSHAAETGRIVKIDDGVVIDGEVVPEADSGMDDYPLDRQDPAPTPEPVPASKPSTPNLL